MNPWINEEDPAGLFIVWLPQGRAFVTLGLLPDQHMMEVNPVFGIKDLMEQAQGLQAKIAAVQEELAEKTVVGSSGGDMVRVVASGIQEILSIKIENELVSSEDLEFLEDLVVAAVNDALRKSRELMTQEMSKLTGGLRLPGFM